MPDNLMAFGALLAVEIHVPTELAAALAQRGKPIPPAISGWALIDTGATVSCVHETALTDLGVPPVGIAQFLTAGGPQERATYPVRLVFPETGWDWNVVTPLAGVDLTGQQAHFAGAPPQPILMLLGRDLLRTCVLVWNGPAATWSLSY
jgi:hypothetical protein